MATALALGASSATSGAGTRGGLRGPSRDWAYGVVIQPDGKIVTAGAAVGMGSGFAVTRYTPAGKLDTSFGQGGTVLTAIGPGSLSRANAIAIQPDGKLVVADATFGDHGQGPTTSISP